MLGRSIRVFLTPSVVKRHLRKIREMERRVSELQIRMHALETAVGRGIGRPTYIESTEVVIQRPSRTEGNIQRVGVIIPLPGYC